MSTSEDRAVPVAPRPRLVPVPAPREPESTPAAQPPRRRSPFPVPVVDVELAGTAGAALPLPAGPASVLLRWRDLPVGCLWLPAEAEPAAALRAATGGDLTGGDLTDGLRRLLGRAGVDTTGRAGADLLALARAQAPGPPLPGPSGAVPAVSAVVCSLGRDPRLPAVVTALLTQAHPVAEVVVVDNDPASARVRRALARLGDPRLGDPRLRIVAEPRRGLSHARNTGLAAVTGDVVAYTDDDAAPDRHWTAELARVFAADPEETVGCVTGLVTPARLDTPWELYFEEYGGFGKGARAVHWSLPPPAAAVARLATAGARGPLFPHAGGSYGTGNNMAFRTAALRELGGFDAALGAGTPTRGGEDLDAFRMILQSGRTIVYTPTALVRHHHRDSARSLRTQCYGYGTGMSATVAKQLLAGPAPAAAVGRALPRSLRILLSPRSAKNRGKSPEFPVALTVAELLGYLAGPVLLLLSRARVACVARRRAPRR